MSEIAVTKVVLPTAKPPATTIFTGIGFALISSTSEGLQTVEDPFQKLEVGPVGGVGGSGVGGQIASLNEVSDQHLGYLEMKVEVSRDFCDRKWLVADIHYVSGLETQRLDGFLTLRSNPDDCLERQFYFTARPTPGHHVGPNTKPM
jgi:hypothetical protein